VGHDLFFDYHDRYMREFGEAFYADTFVANIWTTHRTNAPTQDPGEHDLMWVWDDGGKWVNNPPP